MKISQLSSHFPAQIINLHKVNQNVFDVGFFIFIFCIHAETKQEKQSKLKESEF